MIYINTIILWTLGIVVFLIGSSIATIVYPFDKWFHKSGDYIHIISRYFGKAILYISRTSIQVDGLDNINRDRVYIIISNHQSLFDIFVMDSCIPLQFRFIVKMELYGVPILGWCLRIENQIMLDRNNRRKALESINKAVSTIRNGRSVLIFPEGTRSRDGSIKQFKKGSFIVATRTKASILPITINGTFNILQPKKLLIYPSNVKVTIHPPFETKGLSRLEEKGLAEKIQHIVASELQG